MEMAMFKRIFARTIPDNLRAPRMFARTIPDNLRAPRMKMWGFEAKRARKFTRTSPRTLPYSFHYHAFIFPDLPEKRSYAMIWVGIVQVYGNFLWITGYHSVAFFTHFSLFYAFFRFFFRFSSFFLVFLRFSPLLLKDKGEQQQFTAKMGNFTPTPSAPTPCKTSWFWKPLRTFRSVWIKEWYPPKPYENLWENLLHTHPKGPPTQINQSSSEPVQSCWRELAVCSLSLLAWLPLKSLTVKNNFICANLGPWKTFRNVLARNF